MLRTIMNERDLTIVALAKQTGMAKSTISDWLGGSSPSDLSAVKRMSDVLNVTMAYLTTGENDRAQVATLEMHDMFDNGVAHEGVYRITFQKLEPKKKD
jgi:transcriptional regulator with XRE-family HTH domain